MYGLWLASTAAMFWLPLHPPLQSNSKNPRQFEWQIIWRNGESIDRRPSTKTPYRVKLPRRPPPESLCLLALHGECLRPCKSSRRISNRNLWWMVPPLPLLVVCLRPPRLLPVPPLVSRVARRHVTSLACDPLPTLASFKIHSFRTDGASFQMVSNSSPGVAGPPCFSNNLAVRVQIDNYLLGDQCEWVVLDIPERQSCSIPKRKFLDVS